MQKKDIFCIDVNSRATSFQHGSCTEAPVINSHLTLLVFTHTHLYSLWKYYLPITGRNKQIDIYTDKKKKKHKNIKHTLKTHIKRTSTTTTTTTTCNIGWHACIGTRCGVIWWSGTQRCSLLNDLLKTRFHSSRVSTLSSLSSLVTIRRRCVTMRRLWHETQSDITTTKRVLLALHAWHCVLATSIGQWNRVTFSYSSVYSRDLRIGNFRSNRITNRIGGYDSNSNRISNWIRGTICGLYWKQITRRDVQILLVPQTILHDRSYSASECVWSCYINRKS